MKLDEIDKRINYLKEEIKKLNKVKKEEKFNESTLYGKLNNIIERHLNADNPNNIATREGLFIPIMIDIKTLLKKENRYEY
jgi:hypothetical protein